ncbi:hypothetical protein C8N29_11385 [Agitococcus lubricus]|uniref:Uncharacterized protein n=1 Tax=Agitococcus lubricus TaxID=1077255 RepID=A0A2T5IWN2_9GAMM|nr:hypothetical protein C8N29_11385 [Agitococcus lubricus]
MARRAISFIGRVIRQAMREGIAKITQLLV